jgi:hypothetical protein
MVVTNENLWKLAKEEPVAAAIKRWKWIGHTLRKGELLKKRPEKQERSGEKSRAWL